MLLYLKCVIINFWKRSFWIRNALKLMLFISLVLLFEISIGPAAGHQRHFENHFKNLKPGTPRNFTFKPFETCQKNYFNPLYMEQLGRELANAMLETESVGQNHKMLVTVILVAKIQYLFTSPPGINIQKMSPTSSFSPTYTNLHQLQVSNITISPASVSPKKCELP